MPVNVAHPLVIRCQVALDLTCEWNIMEQATRPALELHIKSISAVRWSLASPFSFLFSRLSYLLPPFFLFAYNSL